MHKKYGKLKNGNVIFEILQIEKDIAYLRNKNLTLTVDIHNIDIISEEFIPTGSISRCTIVKNDENISSELMLRHMTKFEAEEELDRFIFKAVAHHLPQVRIIHGRHGNVLKDTVHEYLDNCEFVTGYEYADYSRGGIGVTVAKLGKKRD